MWRRTAVSIQDPQLAEFLGNGAARRREIGQPELGVVADVRSLGGLVDLDLEDS